MLLRFGFLLPAADLMVNKVRVLARYPTVPKLRSAERIEAVEMLVPNRRVVVCKNVLLLNQLDNAFHRTK